MTMKLRAIILSSLSAIFISACTSGSGESPTAASPLTAPKDYAERNIESMANITAYDVYGAALSDANAVYVSQDVVITPMAWIKGAQKAKLTPIGSKRAFNVFGFTAYNIDDNLVALRVERRITADKLAPLDTLGVPTDGLYTLSVNSRKKTVKNIVSVTPEGIITPSSIMGNPVYNANGQLFGIVGENNRLIPASTIAQILPRVDCEHESVYQLRLKSNKQYPAASSISGFTIHTSMGKISMRLLDQTPEYKENIIRLVTDQFYDSLLVHRVLSNYLIQTGAADSRHAGPDSQVGWQGPGYTIPMHLVPGIFHHRGMVAASKLPQDHNKSNRSDGSQFYIVSGRKFSNKDLDEIEKEYHKKFSAAQREVYSTVGGAPYLDDDYTIFAEVTSGMDVVDRIAALPLNGDRPIQDVRIYRATLIRK